MKNLTSQTIKFYQENHQTFWEDTKDHDVTQNYRNFLDNIKYPKPLNILDFGCGPGRDLKYFSDCGHHAYGLDGCEAFCQMAKKHSNCEIIHQDFLEIKLQKDFYHGIFANASLLHVPKKELPCLLKKLNRALVKNGILFSSNPRGNKEVTQIKYANLMEIDEYKKIVEETGLKLIKHYYRPEGIPIKDRPWLACVFRKS